MITDKEIKNIYKKRKAFGHKGSYGHALLCAGSLGKSGAAILAASGCLRSGVGLLTCHVPKNVAPVIQVAVPEAMACVDKEKNYLANTDYDPAQYAAIGIGPGIGKQQSTQELLYHLFLNYPKPMVIDADALNILAMRQEWLRLIPENSILTPHPKEFTRLFGECSDDFSLLEKAGQMAVTYKIHIVLKGHYTFTATPNGEGYFNTTGNAGMATGGAGDVLTGIITGLLAQGYEALQAAILGVYLHGLAGDIAAQHTSMEAMLAGDIPMALGAAFAKLSGA